MTNYFIVALISSVLLSACTVSNILNPTISSTKPTPSETPTNLILPTPTATSQAILTPIPTLVPQKQITYTNSKYLPFSFNYPQNLTTDAALIYYQSEPLISLKTAPLSLSDNFSINGLFTVSISQNISSDSCYQAPDNGSKTSDKTTINNSDFVVYQSGGAATGSSYDTQIYRLFKNNYCLEITTSVNNSSDFNNPPSASVIESSQSQIKQQLMAILNTFKLQ